MANHGGNVEYVTKTGKTLKIKYLTLKTMSLYENKLQNKAIRTLSEQRANIPDDLFNKMFSELMDKIASGHYAFGSDLCTKSLSTVQGIGDLISILCDIDCDEALDLLMAEGDSFKIVFDEVVKKSVTSKDDEAESTGSGEKKS